MSGRAATLWARGVQLSLRWNGGALLKTALKWQNISVLVKVGRVRATFAYTPMRRNLYRRSEPFSGREERFKRSLRRGKRIGRLSKIHNWDETMKSSCSYCACGRTDIVHPLMDHVHRKLGIIHETLPTKLHLSSPSDSEEPLSSTIYFSRRQKISRSSDVMRRQS